MSSSTYAVEPMSMTRLHRRLGELYGDYRTVLLSKKYYSYRLSNVKRLNVSCDILLAIAASSTFATAQVFHQYKFFNTAGPWASGLVALIAIVKPFLGFEKEIERLSRLVAHYAELFDQMRRLISEIYIEQDMSSSQEWEAKSMQVSMIKLSSFEDQNPKRRKLQSLQAEVHEEMPASFFWYPDEGMAVGSSDGSANEHKAQGCRSDNVPNSGSHLVSIGA